MKSDRDDPRNAVTVSGDDSTGDGGTGWAGGCAAMLLAAILLIAKAVLA